MRSCPVARKLKSNRREFAGVARSFTNIPMSDVIELPTSGDLDDYDGPVNCVDAVQYGLSIFVNRDYLHEPDLHIRQMCTYVI